MWMILLAGISGTGTFRWDIPSKNGIVGSYEHGVFTNLENGGIMEQRATNRVCKWSVVSG